MFKASTNDWLFLKNLMKMQQCLLGLIINTFSKITINYGEKIEKLMRIDFESKPVYGDDDKYIKTKITIYVDSIVTNFHNKKIPKEKSQCKCLSIIILDSVIKANKKYYPQTFLEECKYAQEKTKIENDINDDLNSDSDSNEETESDNDE